MKTAARAGRLFLPVLGAALFLVLLGVVNPSPAAAASKLEVTAGYGGYAIYGRAFPVAVEVTTDRLIKGVLIVSARSQGGPSSTTTVSVPVEVPGGGAKRYVVTVPPLASFPGGNVGIGARLIADGDEVATVSNEAVRNADDRELVGLLPDAHTEASSGGDDGLPQAVPLAVEAGVADFFPIGEAELDQAPASLDPLGTIIAGAEELGRMSPGARRAVLAWLEHGGTLLVGSPPGTETVGGLPDAWQPGPDGTSSAGLGRIRLIGDRARSGDWTGQLFPTPRSSPIDPRFGGIVGGPQSVGSALGADAGLRVPKLGWLLFFLLAYSLIVGPIVGFVLNRRGRAELAWVVIPSVALIFTAGTWGVAKGLRASTTLAHAEIVELSPAGARATTFIGIAARGSMDARVSMPQGTWSAREFDSDPFGGPTIDTNVDVALGSKGPEAAIRLAAGQFAVAALAGPLPPVKGLEVAATSDADGQALGTVRNASPGELDEVVVFVGSSVAKVGHLGPGEEQPWSVVRPIELDRGRFVGRNPFDSVDSNAWLEATDRAGNSSVNYAAWSVGTPFAGVSRPAGVAVGVGWTKERSSSVLINGDRKSTTGRSALVTVTPVRPTAGITNMSVRGEPLRNSNFGPPAGPLGQIVRFVLPDDMLPTGALVASMPVAGRVDVWNGRRWTVTPTNPVRVAGDPVGGIAVDIPREGVVDGQVFVRVANFGAPSIAGSFTLSERR